MFGSSTPALALLLILALLLTPVRAADVPVFLLELPPPRETVTPTSFGNEADTTTGSSFGKVDDGRVRRSFGNLSRAPPGEDGVSVAANRLRQLPDRGPHPAADAAGSSKSVGTPSGGARQTRCLTRRGVRGLLSGNGL